MFDTIIQLCDATLRVSAPLLLACLAGLYSERAGIFDIGLEGKMLAGAFAGASAAAVSGSAWVGLLVATLAAVALALVHGFASITHRGNQIVSGVAINFIVAGSTIILGQAWFRQGGRTPSLGGAARFQEITLPGADAVRDVPIVGPIYSELLSGHSILVYIAFLMVPLTWWVLFRTRFGLRLRAVGENPAAVDTAGISVTWLRYRAVIITGVLTGMAGAYLSVAQNAGFVKDMTAGKGYIALAALIFAKWKPVPAMFACLLFGFLDAASIRIQGSPVGIATWLPPLAILVCALVLLGYVKLKTPAVILGSVLAGLVAYGLAVVLQPYGPAPVRVPVQLVNALPFILTVILLAGFIGKAIPPRAGGVPYVKER
ncbi:ABC transporter permease [Mesorhizobium sp. IMUNJ 23232]|uniref:ABC transporter permease n=1 Tax=Mesorhizobium sp. IMUNJ 23232 TaxID=3376064 RepID=UPI0037B704A3